MLKGMATHEIVDWFNVVKLSAPTPVFEFFCELAEEALSETKWNLLKEGIQEGALLA